MAGIFQKHASVALFGALFLWICFPASGIAGDPHSAYYGTEGNNLLWFIQTSDVHIGTSGSQDSTNLLWLVKDARNTINPSFILVSGDLTDSTAGNWLGIPNGPYQVEWDEYKSIVDPYVDKTGYFDIPGNHDAYNDATFAYYRANSVQGRATGKTQVSFTRELNGKKFHFLGVNTADNSGDGFSIFWPYGDYAGLDTTELGFIADEMNAHPDAELTLVFGHHPLASTGDSQDTYVYYGLPGFLTLMDQAYAPLYGYGHTHDFSEAFFIPNRPGYEGFFYFNVNSLGKSSDNQYTIFAIDCNAVSSKTMTVNAWPAVLITAPVDTNLGGYNPYAYSVPAGASKPIRALVFDKNPVGTVQYRIDGGAWLPMVPNTENPKLYEAAWNASALAEGPHSIEVQATSASGTRGDSITTRVTGTVQTPTAGVTGIATGKYVTSGTRKNIVTTYTPASIFKQGEKVIFRATVKDDTGAPVPGATVRLDITGPSTASITSAASNSEGVAEAAWQTSAPSKKGGGGTPTGSYTATVTGVSASGFVWDDAKPSVSFTLNSK